MADPVKAKIKVFDWATQKPLTKWGGTEVLLSLESDYGPCLVARGASTAAGRGNYYALKDLLEIIGHKPGGHAPGYNGMMSLRFNRLKRCVCVQISAEDEAKAGLKAMGVLLGQGFSGERSWESLPIRDNASRKKTRKGAPVADDQGLAAKLRREEIRKQVQTEQAALPKLLRDGGDESDDTDSDAEEDNERAKKRRKVAVPGEGPTISDWLEDIRAAEA